MLILIHRRLPIILSCTMKFLVKAKISWRCFMWAWLGTSWKTLKFFSNLDCGCMQFTYFLRLSRLNASYLVWCHCVDNCVCNFGKFRWCTRGSGYDRLKPLPCKSRDYYVSLYRINVWLCLRKLLNFFNLLQKLMFAFNLKVFHKLSNHVFLYTFGF